MKKILIIHPEGNLPNNLNLYAIISELCKKGYKVDYFAWKSSSFEQRSYFEGVSLFSARYGRFAKHLIFSRIMRSRFSFFENFFLRSRKYSLIAGVDEGIIPAAAISKKFGIPYGLISYEIFPFGECEDKKQKELEIESCKNIDFAVCQDSDRALLLSRENKIPIEKIIFLPVGGLESKRLKRNYFLHEKLGIEKNKKIAIVMGSIAEWAMIYKIIEDSVTWNKDWVLVIHNRYGDNDLIREIKEKNKNRENIFFSMTPVETCEDMKTVLSSVAAGIAFYNPVYKTKWDGMNLEKIGMSSGKIATFLRHGIPIVINEIGEMSDYVRKFKLGRVVSKDENANPCFSDNEIAEMSENCINFYNERLNLEKTGHDFFKMISILVGNNK